MLIFKTKGIILKINKQKKEYFIYTIFCDQYGIITCIRKFNIKEKNIDLGYIINFEIETKKENKIQKIRNIKILSVFYTEGKCFNILNNYLELLNIVKNNSPYGVEILGIIPIFENINNHHSIDTIKIILSKLKVLNILGILNLENKDPLIKRILKFINKNKIENILKLGRIDEEIKEKLEKLTK